MTYQWQIFLANLEPVVGSEQGKMRPVLVVSEEAINQLLPVVNVLPITTKKPERTVYPNEVFIPAGSGNLLNDSLALCYQIRTLDKQRFAKRLGELTEESLREQIRAALCFQLSLLRR